MGVIEELEKPFKSFLEYIKEIDRVLHVTMYALQSMSGFGRLAEQLDGKDPSKKENIKRVHEMEAMALKESADGFPITLSHSAVSLWASLEATIPDYAAVWLQKNPSALQSERLKKLRLPVAMLHLGREELYRWIVQELQATLDPDAKLGVGRFVALLDALGFDISLPSEVRRDLFELAQIRHLVVHRFGIVDQQFKDKCSFRKEAVGDRVQVTIEDYRRFRYATTALAIKILERGRQRLTFPAPNSVVQETPEDS